MDYFLSGLSYCAVRIDPRDGLRHMTDDHVVEIRSFIHGRNSGKKLQKKTMTHSDIVPMC